MDTASDTEVWRYAAEHGYTIVSKDADFHQRSLVLGRTIWIRQDNCSVADMASLLRERFVIVQRFHENTDAAFLALS